MKKIFGEFYKVFFKKISKLSIELNVFDDTKKSN